MECYLEVHISFEHLKKLSLNHKNFENINFKGIMWGPKN